jgi:hypothetical protein
VPLEAQPISGAKKLIEEVASAPTIPPTPKGILKNSTKAESTPPASIKLDPSLETPAWTWSRDDSGLQVKIQVPKLVRIATKKRTIPTYIRHRTELTFPRPRWTLNPAVYY